jgi:hypothetical protein
LNASRPIGGGPFGLCGVAFRRFGWSFASVFRRVGFTLAAAFIRLSAFGFIRLRRIHGFLVAQERYISAS